MISHNISAVQWIEARGPRERTKLASSTYQASNGVRILANLCDSMQARQALIESGLGRNDQVGLAERGHPRAP